MINNRQGGRRRGRGGGQRPTGNAPNGNRQDNRSRGNAAQLLEKYKALARDAQLAGDRVQTEYFLQFADHYFRVLNEHRARFEEQNRNRDDYGSDEDEDQDDGLAADDDGNEQGESQQEERQQPQRQGRDRNRERANGERTNGEFRPRRERFQRGRDENGRDEGGQGEGEAREERISLEVLPPAIAPLSEVTSEGEVAKAPRRRTRRPRADEGEEIAPAA